jgi:hypothetical protein
MPDTRFPGKVIKLGGVDYVVPAIALGKLRELQPRLEKLNVSSGGMPSGEDLDTIIDMTLAALQRNYPGLERTEIADVLDMSNMSEVIMVVMGQAGLVQSGKAELTQASP